MAADCCGAFFIEGVGLGVFLHLPPTGMNFAAIVIGTGATRLLQTNVVQAGGEVRFHKMSLTRMPLRLGDDVLMRGTISKGKARQLAHILSAYRRLIYVSNVEAWRCCAVSGLHEAGNVSMAFEWVQQQSKVPICLMNSHQEAELIISNHVTDTLDPDYAYLYIDVSEGHTELAIIRQGGRIADESFRVGPLRMLKNQQDEAETQRMLGWVKLHRPPGHPLSAIGMGGSIIKACKLLGLGPMQPATISQLEREHTMLKTMPLEARILELGLRPDRADVIVPALDIYLSLMHAFEMREIYVPKVGLSDGIVRQLYTDHHGWADVQGI